VPRKSILIIGAAGGVGSIAVQLAAKVAGLVVIATASRPESNKWVEELGAHHVINHFWRHARLLSEHRRQKTK
jgi:NADPH:quinone reductase